MGTSGGDSIKGSSKEYRRAMKRLNKAKGLIRTLGLFIQAGVDSGNGRPWVYEKSGPFYGVRPVLVDQHNQYLFDDDIKKVILMSATISRADVARLGITDYRFVEVGSNYKPDTRPVFYRPVGKMSAKNEHRLLPKVVAEMDDIIDFHIGKGHKGILHSVSYQRANDIREYSRHSNIMLLHDQKNKDEIVKKFKDATQPTILVSPSILEGEDFPGDECRFILMPKVPYLGMGDAVVQERMTVDPGWYGWKAIQDIIQGAGRGTRSETDFCSIYVLDGMFEQVVKRHAAEIPEWFKEAVVDFDME